MSLYDWKRFWCPIDGKISLADDGFLYNPESEYGHAINPDVIAFEAIQDMPALVLLGEPGLGKSTAIRTEISVARERAHSSGDIVFETDLGDFGDETRLISAIFDSKELVEWSTSSKTLHVFLDSLDECALFVPNVAKIIRNQLKRLKGEISRLRIRIACRTAEWPNALSDGLREEWGEGDLGIYELAPLRRSDVLTAAEVEALDGEAFLNEIMRLSAQPFAIKPVTLKFLIGTFKSTGTFPSSQTELYAAGCRLLCEESNEDRQAAGKTGSLSPDERLKVAERIAACLAFCGRSAIYRGAIDAARRDEDLTISEMVAEADPTNGNAVTHKHINETLSTGLFSSRGPQRLGFAHKTYAEYLASAFIVHSVLCTNERLKLIRHAADVDGRIVPQLRETAAWIASQDKSIFRGIIDSDPQVLVRSDVASADADDRRNLVQRLLERCERDELALDDWDDRFHYHKLAHPEISNQLEAYIRDKSKSIRVRRFAIDIAEQCNTEQLRFMLEQIVLDPDDTYRVRVHAAYGLVRNCDAKTIERLKSYVVEGIASDSESRITTAIVRRLWPSEISSEDLFLLLPRPTDDMDTMLDLFLVHELADHLPAEDLPAALRWAAGLTPSERTNHAAQRALGRILRLAWAHLSVSAVLAGMVEYSLSQIDAGEDIFPRLEKDFRADEPARRLLVGAIVPRIADFEENGFSLIFDSLRLVRTTDFEWIVAMLKGATEPQLAQRWARLARRLFSSQVPGQLDAVLEVCAETEAADQEFRPLFAAIPLGSVEARRLRAEYKEQCRWEQKREDRKNPPDLDPPPAIRIQEALDACEAGNAEAWYHASRDLQLRPNDTHFLADLEIDLTSLPGWSVADSTTRSRLIDGAVKFLNESDPNGIEWIGTGSTPYHAYAGYKALLLLISAARGLFDSLSVEVWTKWSSIILTFFDHSVPCVNEEFHNEIAAVCAGKAPGAVDEGLRLICRRYDRDDDHFFLPNFLDRYSDDRIRSVLCDLASDNSLKPAAAGALLDYLLKEGKLSKARDVAAQIVENLPISTDSNGVDRKRAVLAAVALLGHAPDAGWNVVWPKFFGDIQFGREVMETVAYKDMRNATIAMRISDSEAATLFIWLEQQYPSSTDPEHKGAHHVSRRDSIKSYRDGVLRILQSRGAVRALRHIQSELPHLEWMNFVINQATNELLKNSWQPLAPKELFALAASQESQLVRSAGQFQNVVIESLARMQSLLQGETPTAPSLWDERANGKFRPKDEEHLSDFVKVHLETDLARRGIVSLREVQIRRGEGNGIGRGERTDIHVTGVVQNSSGSAFTTVRVIIEVKGEWNAKLDSAMENQLVGRYLKDNSCQHGIYLVGWYRCAQWDTSDRRANKCKHSKIDGLRISLGATASSLSADGISVRSMVLNAALR